MSRRTQAPKRVILPDPKYKSELLAKFMNMIMNDGKKSVAERIVYGALDRINEKETHEDAKALELLETALDNVKPVVEVKSRRVGGATYQVPIEVRPARRQPRHKPRHVLVVARGGKRLLVDLGPSPHHARTDGRHLALDTGPVGIGFVGGACPDVQRGRGD